MATVNRAPNFHVLRASTFIFSATRNRKLLILFERRYRAKHERTAAVVVVLLYKWTPQFRCGIAEPFFL